jgi:hypothetical protein
VVQIQKAFHAFVDGAAGLYLAGVAGMVYVFLVELDETVPCEHQLG